MRSRAMPSFRRRAQDSEQAQQFPVSLGVASMTRFRVPHPFRSSVVRGPMLAPPCIRLLQYFRELDGNRDFQRTMRVDHQFNVGANPTAGRLHPAYAVGDREAVAPNHAHLDRAEALGSVAAKFRLGLLARRPATAGVAAYRTAYGTKRMIQRNTERQCRGYALGRAGQ